MIGQLGIRIIRISVLVLAVVLLMGCRASDPEPPGEPAALDGDAPTATAVVDLPLPTPSPSQAGSTLEAEPTVDSTQLGLPPGLTSNEVAAARFGESVYSGYSCVLTPEGCACEIPVIERSSFTFVSENTMTFAFKGDGYAAVWEMSHLGPDQWSYTLPMIGDAGEFQGAFFSLLTFTEDGYVYNLGADFDEGGIVTCPDVTFRRISSAE
jgi:hypothetical protein